jgi:integrase
MSQRNSTAPAPSAKPPKPDKPYPDFPLYAHAAGVWAKRIRGKLYYFGRWNDPEGALKKYHAEKEALHAGRKPREAAGAADVKQLCNGFLAHKRSLVDSGELTLRTWEDYQDASVETIAAFGKTRILADLDTDDFADLRKRMAKKWGSARLAKAVQCVRSLFKYGFDAGLLDTPVRFGPGFKRPSKRVMRLERAKAGPKVFTPAEVRAMAEGALVVGDVGPKLVQGSAQLRAMVLLGINAALGNADVGRLPMSASDLDMGWLNYPRPKTGVARRAWLWPETVAALREALASRPEPKDAADAGLCFITKYGESWAKNTRSNPVSAEARKLLDALGIRGNRSFYDLRHTFRTVADGARDQPAADHVMGHEVAHMSSHYREGIADERLRAVCEYVRQWMYGDSPDAVSTVK